MKKISTNSAIKMLSLTIMALASMLTQAFCQKLPGENSCPAGINCFTVNITPSSGQKATFRLPKDIRSGDMISGTVIEENRSETKTNRSSSTLEGMVIEIDGKQTKQKDNLFSFIVPAGIATLPFILKNSAGEIIERGSIPVQQTISSASQATFNGSRFYSGNIAQPGQTIPVYGKFDGNAANTNISLNGQALEIVAENPRTSYANISSTATAGGANLSIQENNVTENHRMNILSIELSADKLDLTRGQQINIRAQVSGMDNLDPNQKIQLNIENHSPSTISFTKEAGVVITKEITSAQARGGVYEYITKVVATTAGGFSITAKITAGQKDADCLKIYQDCMATIKASRAAALKKCNDAGGDAIALGDCIGRANTEADKLEKACFEAFEKCRK